MLGIKPMATRTPGQGCASELHPGPGTDFIVSVYLSVFEVRPCCAAQAGRTLVSTGAPSLPGRQDHRRVTGSAHLLPV